MQTQINLPRLRVKALSQRRGKPLKWQDALSYIVLTIAAILVLMPLLWMFSQSLQPIGEGFRLPPSWLPTQWNWDNYLKPFQAREGQFSVPFALFFGNSFKIATLTTIGQLITCSMAGYAFARLRFPGRDILFMVLLAALMVPGQVTIIPIYLMMADLGLVNTHESLILPGLVNIFGVFLMRQFFKQMPQELFDAARGWCRALSLLLADCAAFGRSWFGDFGHHHIQQQLEWLLRRADFLDRRQPHDFATGHRAAHGTHECRRPSGSDGGGRLGDIAGADRIHRRPALDY